MMNTVEVYGDKYEVIEQSNQGYLLTLKLRPVQDEPKAGWRVYDVIRNKRKYYVKDLGSCGGDVFLPNAAGMVGFGGVQFEGQHGDGWHMTPCFMDGEGGTYEFSSNGDKPAVPIRARFWEDAQ
jgi:hypothetical protein